jgi:hypothetical protein
MHLRHSLALGATLATLALATVAAAPVLAHEQRQVAGYSFEVGFIDEPVYVGQRTGLELIVTKDEQGVEGLEQTLKAQVTKDGKSMDLVLASPEGEAGTYHGIFIPTEAGPYTFHLSGTVDGQAVDESFTSSATGFDEVQEAAAGQFPVQLPTQADVAAQAQKGADASTQATIGIVVGAIGIVLAIVALGVALASRRKPAA